MKISNPIAGLLAASLVAVAAPGRADGHYDYQLVDYPGTPITNLFGINNRGDASGNGYDGGDANFPFTYRAGKDTFTDLPVALDSVDTSVIGISDSGVVTGSVADEENAEIGFILDKQGVFAFFEHPDAVMFTQGRGLNGKGLVSGIYGREDATFGFVLGAFIYDSKTGTFTDPLDAGVVTAFAHGINSRGDVVGNAVFLEDPCGSGDIFVRYSWRRAADGSIVYFNVNGGPTSARGINDHGTVTGFLTDPVTFERTGFVTKLGHETCQDIVIADSDLLKVPGRDTLPEGITNAGTVVGVAEGEDSVSGFIATPQ